MQLLHTCLNVWEVWSLMSMIFHNYRVSVSGTVFQANFWLNFKLSFREYEKYSREKTVILQQISPSFMDKAGLCIRCFRAYLNATSKIVVCQKVTIIFGCIAFVYIVIIYLLFNLKTFEFLGLTFEILSILTFWICKNPKNLLSGDKHLRRHFFDIKS